MMDKTLYLMVYDSLPEESKKAISELWDTGINNSGVWVRFGNVEATIGKVIWPFRNYTVDMEVLKQVQWERDIALEQLEKIGKSLGEKMDDIAEAIKNNSDYIKKQDLLKELEQDFSDEQIEKVIDAINNIQEKKLDKRKQYIYSCLKFRNRHEKSMNTIGLYAENILFRWNHELDQLLKDETDEK